MFPKRARDALRREIKASAASSKEILSDQEESTTQEPPHNTYETATTFGTVILQPSPTVPYLAKPHTHELEYISRLQTGMSLDAKLPYEILSYIIKLCAEETIGLPPWSLIPCFVLPQVFVLSQVCSRWRQVALKDPSLWNSVDIENPRKLQPEILNVILSRAGYTIKLYLVMVGIVPPPIIHVIHHYSPNIQTLELDCDLQVDVKKLPTQLEVFQELRLYVADHRNISGPAELYSAFSDASDCQQLDIGTVDDRVGVEPGTSPLPLFPWTHLQHLTLLGCNMLITELLHIFAQCTQLKTCRANLTADDSASPASETQPPTSILINLDSLKSSSFAMSVDELFDSFAAPSLRVLNTEGGTLATRTLLHFIRRSKCDIQWLKAALIPSSPQDITELFLAMPGLIHLSLTGSTGVSKVIIDALSASTLLPNVEVLECEVSSCKAVKELALKRCKPGPDGSTKAIQKFSVRVPPHHFTEEWQVFHASLPLHGAIKIVTWSLMERQMMEASGQH